MSDNLLAGGIMLETTLGTIQNMQQEKVKQALSALSGKRALMIHILTEDPFSPTDVQRVKLRTLSGVSLYDSKPCPLGNRIEDKTGYVHVDNSGYVEVLSTQDMNETNEAFRITPMEYMLKSYLKKMIEVTEKLCKAKDAWIALSLLNPSGLVAVVANGASFGDKIQLPKEPTFLCLCPQKVVFPSNEKSVHNTIEQVLCTLFNSFGLTYYPTEF